MKIELCDDCVYVDGVERQLISNNAGADRIRQTIVIGVETGSEPAVEEPVAPAPQPMTTTNVYEGA